MADVFTYLAITINLNDGYSLNEGAIGKNNEDVKIQFSNVGFMRKMGKKAAIIVANGLEKFSTLALAKTFRDDITNMEGEDVLIKHDRLTLPAGENVECLRVDAPGILTNKTPGFHIIWLVQFRVFP